MMLVAALPVAGLAVALFVALVGLGIVLNHCYARLAVVELTLNEGLPPGHERHATIDRSDVIVDAGEFLPPGVHIFLSRNCHACQRLIDELDHEPLAIDASLHLRYVDRPRPVARSAADRQDATLHDHQAELISRLGVDPLPYTVAIGDHELVSRAVTPTIAQVVQTARDAGFARNLAPMPAIDQ